MKSIFATADKIQEMKRKLEALKVQVLRDDWYDMLPNLVSAFDDKREGIDAESMKNLNVVNLSSPTERFEFYFSNEQYPIKGIGWISNSLMPLRLPEEWHWCFFERQVLQLHVPADEGFKIIF